MTGTKTSPLELELDAAIDRPDDVFAALAELVDGCSDEEAMKRMAKLILMLANQVGSADAIERAIDRCRS